MTSRDDELDARALDRWFGFYPDVPRTPENERIARGSFSFQSTKLTIATEDLRAAIVKTWPAKQFLRLADWLEAVLERAHMRKYGR